MKFKLMIASVLILISEISYADCMPAAQIANQFLNAYVNHIVGDAQKNENTTLQWLQQNTLVTENFKNAYQQLLNKLEQEGGYMDADYILNAQDFPEKGFKIQSCNETANTVILEGIDWQEFKVTVKMLDTETGWQVDGSGSLNMDNNEVSSNTIRFEDFLVAEKYTGKPAPLDYSSNPQMKHFKTYLTTALETGANFAGNYTIVEIGCGSSCQAIYILNTQNGKFVAQITACLGASYQIDSRLLIINPPLDGAYFPPGCETEHYVLENETLKLL